jgi:ribosomal protein S18 acetylase RimI-like enzyme
MSGFEELKYFTGRKSTPVIFEYFRSLYGVDNLDFLKDKEDTTVCVFPHMNSKISELIFPGMDTDALIKLVDNNIVGILQFEGLDDNIGIYIHMICSIKPGVGSELLDIAKGFIRANKVYKYLELFPASDRNIEYYRKRGFRGDERSMRWEPSYEGGRRRRRRRKTSKKRIRVNGTRRRR